MNKSIAERLTRLSVRLEELNQLLSSEKVTTDLDNYRKITRERSEIIPVVELYHAHLQTELDIQTAKEMSTDPHLRDFAEAELVTGKEKLQQIETELLKQLLPKDPSDERNIFLKYEQEQGAMNLHYLRVICLECTRDLRNDRDGKLRSFLRAHRMLADTKRLSLGSSDMVLIHA